MVCKKSEQFNEVVKRIFLVFPKLKNKNIYFLCNANVIEKNKTISENGIKNNGAVLIIIN